MAARAFQIRLLTREGVALEDRTVSVIAPGELGYLGILYNHAPLVTTLQPGKLTWRTPAGAQRTVLIGEGLLEVCRNQLTVLTDRFAQHASPAARQPLA